MATSFRLITQLVAFGDSGASNPSLRHLDWRRDISGLQVTNPRREAYDIPAGQERVIWDGTRALTVDGTTEFEVELVAGKADRYRFRHTGGTAPGFRTDRALDLAGDSVTATVNANDTLTLVTDGSFAAVQAGDTLWLPSTDEIDTSPFSSTNRGFWVVLSANATTVVLERPGDFEGVSEADIAVTDADQVQAFSASGVQVGETLEVLAGFVSATQRSYTIEDVTPSYLEVQSQPPIPNETGITPGADNFLVFTSVASFVYIEADQECAVKVNGDTGTKQRLSPWLAGDKVGQYMKTGPVWSLSVLNRSPLTAHVDIISVE